MIGEGGIVWPGGHLLEIGAVGAIAGEKEQTPAEFWTRRFRSLSAGREEDAEDYQEKEMASVFLHY